MQSRKHTQEELIGELSRTPMRQQAKVSPDCVFELAESLKAARVFERAELEKKLYIVANHDPYNTVTKVAPADVGKYPVLLSDTTSKRGEITTIYVLQRDNNLYNAYTAARNPDGTNHSAEHPRERLNANDIVDEVEKQATFRIISRNLMTHELEVKGFSDCSIPVNKDNLKEYADGGADRARALGIPAESREPDELDWMTPEGVAELTKQTIEDDEARRQDREMQQRYLDRQQSYDSPGLFERVNNAIQEEEAYAREHPENILEDDPYYSQCNIIPGYEDYSGDYSRD